MEVGGVVVEIAAGYGALKSAYEIAKGLKDIHDRVALNAAIIDLQEKILSAQESSSTTSARVRDLEETIKAFDDWEQTASRYALRDFGDESYAYATVPEKLNGTPAHLACPNCFREKRLSILQFNGTYSGRRKYDCQACGKSVDLGAARHVKLPSGGPKLVY